MTGVRVAGGGGGGGATREEWGVALRLLGVKRKGVRKGGGVQRGTDSERIRVTCGGEEGE